MTKYAKLTEAGQLQILARIPYVSNPTEEMVAKYALENGYKPLEETPSPGSYYNKKYIDAGDKITTEWEPWNLDVAKSHALNIIQARRNNAMNDVVIPCEGLPNGILYNTEAVTNALAMMVMQTAGQLPEGQTWTDAADETHPLTPELLAAISAAMVAHGNSVQESVRPARDAVRAAENVDDVEKALHM